jgi:DNA (cytosine-5)-methyltransferase 1
MKVNLRTGPWFLSDLKNVPQNGLKVFSCFNCAGGSTMGYKLAGFDVLGGVEIDPQMMTIYKSNHNPRYSYLMGVQQFNQIPNNELPDELFNLDVLDGSPPCSSFSMAGSREKAWGKKKKFREGQANQVLDDLFFHFIETAKKLQPKVVIAENVKGLILGNAKGYVKQIFKHFHAAGYNVQLFLLNASAMGVPQRRERTFFVANKIGKNLKLNFNEKNITFLEIEDSNATINDDLKLTATAAKYFFKCKPGNSFSSVHEKGSLFNWIKVDPLMSLPTLASGNAEIIFHYRIPRKLTNFEWMNGQTFPLDLKCEEKLIKYVCGMSVPPFMMQRLANQLAIQFFSKNI